MPSEVEMPNPEKTAEILTAIGLEVGSVEEFASVKGGLKGLVIGEVLHKSKHPNADRLSLTKVNIGTQELPIVCGAPNVDSGQKVVVAPVGTTIHPSEGDSFEIRKAKIRGEVSEGMICAEDEIGLGKGHDGILVLPSEVQVGTLAQEYFGVTTDTVIEIDLTPNRVDAASHFGVARDLLAYLSAHQNQSFKTKPRVYDLASYTSSNALPIQITVKDSEKCPRYAGVCIAGVTVGPSPNWLQNKLKSIGLQPINNVVDITNYVLHDMGQPLHAFDYDQIKGGHVVVRTEEQNTEFITLDEEKRILNGEDLMICDEEKGMCIAGVFGGKNSGVSEKTQNVFLESAYFNPVSIRKTAKRHALQTDASFRFERGIDPNITLDALQYAAELICKVAGGKIASDIIDIQDKPASASQVELSEKELYALIGCKIEKSMVERIFEGLEIKIRSFESGQWLLQVPPYRVDVTRSADVIEEVLRIYGYDQVPVPEKLSTSIGGDQDHYRLKLRSSVSKFLQFSGFTEVIHNSLTEEAGLKDPSQCIQILNPLSSELAYLRDSLCYNMIECISRNVAHKTDDLRLFEFGKTYQKKAEGYFEETQLSLVVSGKSQPENWTQPENDPMGYYHIKGIFDELAEYLGLKKIQFTEKTELSHPALSFLVEVQHKKKTLGYVGEVAQKWLDKYDIVHPVFYAELNWDKIAVLSKDLSIQFKKLSKFPSMRRDLALLLDSGVEFADLRKIALQSSTAHLQKVGIFDVYKGKSIESGKKSYALSFLFQDPSKTLTDEEVDTQMNKIIDAYKKKYNAVVR